MQAFTLDCAAMKKEDIYYQAMLARDHRFDGKFFIGVKTTGIYCRPICPAKPKRQNVEFFANYIEAEKAGYRPCLRCRPESAPRSPAWIGTSAIVKRAVKMISNPQTLDWREEEFASLFGVSPRHLRRLFIDEIGKTPKQLATEHRLHLARKLITETALPITEIAFASGFGSIRRFNDAFKDRFKKSPSTIRRQRLAPNAPLSLTLSYRPPFDYEGLLASYANHRIGDLEWFETQTMHRLIYKDGQAGVVSISNDSKNSRLVVAIDFPDASVIHWVVHKVREMFDLNSDPLLIANTLDKDMKIKKILQKYPGIRMASGWDAFEISIGTILGQLVSLERARQLVTDLIEIAGSESGYIKNGINIKLFPTPEQIATADLSLLKTTGMRKQTLIAFSKALVCGDLSLEPTQEVDPFIDRLLQIKGIGAWTASYISLKVLRHTDAFPSSDLILARALKIHSKKSVEAMSPWRSYVACLFWREYYYKK
jgi:AraC family transcriptional regulator of adaptative response / DNA-3-methyladenine glycosylase II